MSAFILQLKTRPFRSCKILILSASTYDENSGPQKIFQPITTRLDEKSAESLIQNTQEDKTK